MEDAYFVKVRDVDFFVGFGLQELDAEGVFEDIDADVVDDEVFNEGNLASDVVGFGEVLVGRTQHVDGVGVLGEVGREGRGVLLVVNQTGIAVKNRFDGCFEYFRDLFVEVGRVFDWTGLYVEALRGNGAVFFN